VSWREVWEAVRTGLQRTWEASRPLSITMGATSILVAVVPAGLALMSGAVVTEVEALLESGERSFAPLFPWLLLAAVLLLVIGVGQVARRYAEDRLGDEMGLLVSREVLEHAASLDLAFFESKENHDTLSRASSYPGRSYLQFVSSVYETVSVSIEFLSLLAVMVWIHASASLALAFVTIPFLVFRWRMAKVRFEVHRAKTTKRRQAGYFSSLLIHRDAVPTTKVFGLASLLTDRFATTMRELLDVDRDLYRRLAVGRALVSVGYALVFVVAVGLVAARTLEGSIAIGALVTYLASANRFRGASVNVVNTIADFMQRVLFVRDLTDFMAARPVIVDREARTLPELRGEVEMRGVSFRYPGTSREVVRDIDLSIRAGETVAVVGPNGAGKTTLVKLIARLYEADRGRVLVDGHDVRSLAVRWYHDQIAYVGQSPVRFEATLEENIAFGDWKRLLGRSEEVEELAQRLGLGGLLEQAPDGMQTLLGRRFGDHDLSGGQWQLLAMGRALARNASIVILDEPTSNLDARAEYAMFERFHKLTRGRTTILVSHRFSTVGMADRIFVMDEGRLVESGTHEELLARRGVYASLYAAHRLRFEPEAAAGGAR
jgi:ATP-binding cassette subfamily B protein